MGDLFRGQHAVHHSTQFIPGQDNVAYRQPYERAEGNPHHRWHVDQLHAGLDLDGYQLHELFEGKGVRERPSRLFGTLKEDPGILDGLRKRGSAFMKEKSCLAWHQAESGATDLSCPEADDLKAATSWR